MTRIVNSLLAVEADQVSQSVEQENSEVGPL